MCFQIAYFTPKIANQEGLWKGRSLVVVECIAVLTGAAQGGAARGGRTKHTLKYPTL